uniref:Integrase, catalytic region, zinc finger, CCHC-type, peptidase aspartic, catalytic n=1 Tax=Tanacetum cinerariifolium TaxID=118510 RepID=A0A6L2KV27_TANCI|nr:integrase, catalytic region, zinc finger, CCHC-type, peptidase aspartic, catalytic [Tanacetum cinerariifolium]
MEEYMSKTRADYGSGVTRPKIDDNDHFELKCQFLKELRDNTFSGSDHEDVNEHIEKVLEIVDLFHIPCYRNKITSGFENRPPMLTKENYVPWSSRLLRYAKSRPNGKLIHNFIINGPYVRRMIPKPGDPNREVPVNETFPVQTDDELTEKELKQIEANDQAIQTILLVLPEDIYAAVDSYPTTAMNMALTLMGKAFKLNYSTPTNNNQRISSNPCNRQIAQPSMNIGQDRHMQMIGDNGGSQNQVIQNAIQNLRVQNVRNQNGQIVVPRNVNRNPKGNGNLVAARAEGNATGHNGNQIRCYNCRGVGHFARNCTVRQRRRDVAYLQTQLLIAQKEEAGTQLQAEDFDLMAAAADLDEIEEVNANCILMANLQQASTSEADKSLAKHKALEWEIKRLLRAVVSQDIMSIVQNNSVDETSNLQTELHVRKNDLKIVSLKRRMNMLKFGMIGVDNTKTGRPQPRSNTKNDRVPSASKSSRSKNKDVEVEEHHRKLLLSRNKKHMSYECNNVKLATQNVKSKVFLGTVRFGNDHVAAIMGFGDLQWGNILITRVYFVQGLGHNLFLVGQFCDSDLEDAFRRNTCFVRNLEGVVLLSGNQTINLYTINLHEMTSASPICLMARASSTKSWLWHQRLSHLNFDTINNLAKSDLVSDLPKFKYHKEHLCPSCEQGKSKRASHPPKLVPNSRQRLHLLHIDLCGLMRIASINGKRYVLMIVDDYSHYTWVHFLRSKDEAPKTLVEAAIIMLIFSHAPLFLWAEVIATACFTQNRSIIHRQFNKTSYELINGKKPDIFFLHVFGALCYPKNDPEDIGKLGAKGDIGFFIGYFANSCAFRVYNRRTKKNMKTMNVSYDELSVMAFEQCSSKLGLQSMNSGQISLGLDLTYAPSTITTQQPTKGELDLLFEAMYDDYIGGQLSATLRTVLAVQAHQDRQTTTTSTSIADTTPTPTISSSQATNFPNPSQDVDGLNSQQQHAQQQGYHALIQPEIVVDNVPNAMFDANTFVNPFATPSTSAAESSSSQYVDTSNMHTFYQPYPHESQWTKDHPLEQVIREPSRPVLTRNQLRSDGDMCMYALTDIVGIVPALAPSQSALFLYS